MWTELTSFKNLWAAWLAASRGKRGTPDVANFELDAEAHLFSLQRSLTDGSYRPGGYRSFLIFDPKRRLVSAAPFIDRIVHHALVQAIEPAFEATFIGDSYANRVGKGTHAAIEQAQRWAIQYRYVLQCDLRQFFPSVDHAVLLKIFARKITCERTLALCALILASGDGVLGNEYDMHYFADDDLLAVTRPRGLPIGNLTSQFWSNVLMNEIDQLVKRNLRCKAYLRYVDDFLLFSDDKKTLWAWKDAIREKLSAMRLSMHEKSSTVYPCGNGIGFLGQRIYPTHRRLKTRNARAFEARMREWHSELAAGILTREEISQRVRGWVAHAEHANTVGLRTKIFSKPWKKST
jgi:RNA-directed DNA polymerase